MTPARRIALVFGSNVNGTDPVPVIETGETWIHHAVVSTDQLHVVPVEAVTVTATEPASGGGDAPGKKSGPRFAE
jgi:hypothetical protein